MRSPSATKSLRNSGGRRTLPAPVLLLALLPLSLSACRNQGNGAGRGDQARISNALGEMQTEFTEGMDRLERRLAEIRGEAQRAMENGDTTLAGRYGEAASGLEAAKTRLSARWDHLKANTTRSWDEVQSELTGFRDELNSVVDSLGAYSPG